MIHKFTAEETIGTDDPICTDSWVEVTLRFNKKLKNARYFVSGALADAEAATAAPESDLSDVCHILDVLYQALTCKGCGESHDECRCADEE